MEIAGVSQTGSGLTDRSMLSHEEFMEVLLAQITTQDPTDPLDNEEMMRQIVTLQEMQNQQALAATMEQMALEANLTRFEGQFAGATGLIGYDVKGTTAAGTPVEGEVVKVTVESGVITTWVLEEGAEDPVAVPYANITEVSQPEEEGEGGEGGGA